MSNMVMENIPDGWRVEKLGNIANYINGKAFKPNEWSENGIRIVRIQNLNGNQNYNYYNKKIEKKYVINNGDILISWSASLGVYKWNDGKAVLNQHIFNTEIDNTFITNDYFFWTIKNSLKIILSNLHGSTMKHITKGRFEKIQILLPPLQQQKKIVKVLDISSALVEKQKELIANYDLFLKSKFIEMFGSIKNNPYNFNIEPLSKFGKIITGNTPPRKELKNYGNDFIEWVKTDNISPNKLYVSTAKEYLSKLGMSKGRVLEKDGLLITCIAGSVKSIANVAMTNRKITFNQQINAIQPNKDINPLYLYWLIKLNKNYILTFATSSMKKMITKGVFQEIPFIKAPIDLQNKFSAIALKIETIKTKETKKLNHLETLHKSLMDKAFKGEIK